MILNNLYNPINFNIKEINKLIKMQNIKILQCNKNNNQNKTNINLILRVKLNINHKEQKKIMILNKTMSITNKCMIKDLKIM